MVLILVVQLASNLRKILHVHLHWLFLNIIIVLTAHASVGAPTWIQSSASLLAPNFAHVSHAWKLLVESPKVQHFFSLSQLCSFNNVPKLDCFQGLCNKCPKAYFDLEVKFLLNHLKQSMMQTW